MLPHGIILATILLMGDENGNENNGNVFGLIRRTLVDAKTEKMATRKARVVLVSFIFNLGMKIGEKGWDISIGELRN